MKHDNSAQMMRVLVVDDEALARKGLMLRLQDLGYR
jgi:CheY-like chemotaxis protein